MDPRPYHYEYRRPRFSNPTFKSDHLYQSIYHFGSNGTFYPNIDKIPNNGYSLPVRNMNHAPIYGEKQSSRQQKIAEQIRKIDPYIQDKVNDRNYPPTNAVPNNNNKYDSNYNRNGRNTKQPYQMEQFNRQIQTFTPPKQRSQLKKYPNADIYKSTINPHKIQNNSENNKQPIRSYSQDANTNKKNYIEQNGYLSNYGSRLVGPMVRRGDQDYVYERQQKPYNIINCYPKQVVNTHRNYPKYTLEHKLIQNGHYPLQYTSAANPEY